MTVAIAFVAYAAWHLAQRWQSTRVSLSWPLAFASILPLALGCLIQGRGWIALLERMTGQRVPRKAGLALYMDSQLARYTPGMVGLPLVRIAGAERLGVPALLVGSSVGFEMLSWTAVGGAVGFSALLGFDHAALYESRLGALSLVLLALFALGLLVLVALDRARLPGFLRRALGADGGGPLLPVALPLMHLAYWLTWLAHGVLLSLAFGAPSSLALSGSGFYALATVGGFIALAAPAGVGVRESILSMALASTLGVAPALAIAVASRAASLLADVGVWLALRGAGR
ncbi:MAG TPA: hypothetical protein VGM29_02340 [Polyangiaceae bacterium]|jgi:hypothetical protein